MTRSQLIAIVAKKANLTKRAAEDATDALFEEITRALAKGEKVVISKFGTFYVSKIADKEVVPFGKHNERTTVKAHRIVNFRVGKPLRNVTW